MMPDLRSLLDRHPALKALARRLLRPLRGRRGVSSHYVEIAASEALAPAHPLHQSWKHGDLPDRQRHLVDGQLAEYRVGRPVRVFDCLVDCLRALPDKGGATLLEVGCSSGYYSEVLRLAGFAFQYTGCDYSPAFIELARACHPEAMFAVGDATRLDYADEAFDTVVSGCCLLHIPDYQTAVAETARVARHHAIFHRTPVVVGQPDRFYRKQAYGVETIEIHFNEPDFLALLQSCGLVVLDTRTLDESILAGKGSAVRTYVCAKKAH